MYPRQNQSNDKPFQLVQLSSFRKKHNETLISMQQNKITFHAIYEGTTLLTILGIYQFINNKQINQELLTTISLQQCPKAYLPYAHQETMKVLLKVLLDNSSSQSALVCLVNEFPVLSFVIEAYCRALCLSYMNSKKDIFLYGNQQEIIQNFGVELRGSLLNFMIDALGMSLTLVCDQITQKYGQQDNKRKVSIVFTENHIQAELVSSKKTQVPIHYVRSNQSSVKKTLKQINSIQTETSESQHVSSIDDNSLFKDNQVTSEIDKCQKCKQLKKRCFCTKKVVSSYDTPKSATKIDRSIAQSNPNSNIFSLLNHSKCVCHKIVCTCRK